MGLQLSPAATRAALVYLGVDIDENVDASSTLENTLAEYNLDVDQFMTPETMFACGYQRGINSASFSPEDQVPSNGDSPDSDLVKTLEDGYACGMEARELAKSPPASLVFAAHQDGTLSWGQMEQWASGLDLSDTFRLAHAVTVSVGKDGTVIPAGTPVDVIEDGFDKDGVNHVIVAWDGLALIIPNPDDSPNLVSGDTEIAPERKRRRGKTGSKRKSTPKERGPTLRQSILAVLEGSDGGPGPLQTNGAFGGRVLAHARENGIGDKAGKFIQKADKHVPYYLNCYKPAKDGSAGRLGVDAPFEWVIAAIEGRKYYLKADGSHEDRMGAIPEEITARMEDTDARVATTAKAPKEPAETTEE